MTFRGLNISDGGLLRPLSWSSDAEQLEAALPSAEELVWSRRKALAGQNAECSKVLGPMTPSLRQERGLVEVSSTAC